MIPQEDIVRIFDNSIKEYYDEKSTNLQNEIKNHDEIINEMIARIADIESSSVWMHGQINDFNEALPKLKRYLDKTNQDLNHKISKGLVIFIILLAYIFVFVLELAIEHKKMSDKLESIQNDTSNNIINSTISDKSSSHSNYYFGTIQTDENNQPKIIYDKDSKVMYIMSSGGNYTVMLNSDGTPRLYNEED